MDINPTISQLNTNINGIEIPPHTNNNGSNTHSISCHNLLTNQLTSSLSFDLNKEPFQSDENESPPPFQSDNSALSSPPGVGLSSPRGGESLSSPPRVQLSTPHEGNSLSSPSLVLLSTPHEGDSLSSPQEAGALSSVSTCTGLGRPPTDKRLTNVERQHIIELLLRNLNNEGKPIRGLMTDISRDFKVSTRSVSKLWRVAKEQINAKQPINVAKKRSGRKKTVFDLSNLVNIPLRRRTNIRSLAKALGMSKSTTHRLVQAGEIHSHTNAIKPQLTKENHAQRLAFILSKLQNLNASGNPCFEDMSTTIHIDEKWFYMSRMSQRYYLSKHEVEPHRSCKSKRFMTKLMFLGVVTPPRYSEDGQCTFDGKIGIFPFTVIEPAKRKSKNRQAGQLECKPINSITKEVIKKCLIEQVLPAIKAKWPLDDSRVIYIQQDNARPHISPNDQDFINAATSDGFDIRLTFQPSNSPDLNVLDLGFFNAIQSLQHEEAPRNVVELCDAVSKSFYDLQPRTLSNVWLTLQYCMLEILKANGSNAYKIPHVGKARMARDGTLPTQVEVDATIVSNAIQQLEILGHPFHS